MQFKITADLWGILQNTFTLKVSSYRRKMSSNSNVALLIKTADFAAKKHKDQRRKDVSKTPYINHPIGVANILVEEAGVEDISVLQAALLHDTVEDTETTIEELSEIFGSKVASIVKEVTDDKLKSKEERKRLQVETAPHKSHSAKLVKMADKIYNLRDLEKALPLGWDHERRQKYFLWAREVVTHCYNENQKLATILKDIFARNIK